MHSAHFATSEGTVLREAFSSRDADVVVLRYTTDAATRSQQVKEAFRPAEDTYRPVLYPVAVVTGSKQSAIAQGFLDLLMSHEGQAVLGRFGFLPPPAGVR